MRKIGILLVAFGALFAFAQTTTGGPTLAETLELLSSDLSEVPLNLALDDIEAWEVELNASEDPALQEMANQLGELRGALEAEPIDTATASQLLTSLGQQTLEVAAGAEGETGSQLTRLGTLLSQAGEGLSGGGMTGGMMTGGMMTGGMMTGGMMTGGMMTGGGN